MCEFSWNRLAFLVGIASDRGGGHSLQGSSCKLLYVDDKETLIQELEAEVEGIGAVSRRLMTHTRVTVRGEGPFAFLLGLFKRDSHAWDYGSWTT